jgi:hypothetical protein
MWMRIRLLLAACLLLGGAVAQAQEPSPTAIAGMSPDEVTMLHDINRSRLRENLVHLVPNPRLNELARFYIADLAARPINALGDVFLTRDNRNFDAMLTEIGYPTYPGGRVADFVPMIIRDFNPQQIVDYWFRNYAQADLRSRRMIREGESLLPVFSPLYREIGIAANFNQTTQRYYYVIVFAAQPNMLPVVVTEFPALNRITTTVSTRDVILYVHDERVVRFGGDDFIGAIEALRISSSPDSLPCTGDSSQGWRPYENEIPYRLADTPGLQTVYVQMCDTRGFSIMMSVPVVYQDQPTPTPTASPSPTSSTQLPATPDVNAIANATQTAAASATAFAPYLATVEVILTATAAAE